MKSETRHTIIRTASDLFYSRGYNLVGINEIIAESGIAKATLYSHFKSKEDLLVAYLDAKDEELLENLKNFTDSKEVGNDRLLAVLEFLMLFFNQEGFNGCWCIRSVAEVPRDNERIRNKISGNKRVFWAFVRALVGENKPALDTAAQEQLTNELYLSYEGALTESHIHNSDWPITTAIRLMTDRVTSYA